MSKKKPDIEYPRHWWFSNNKFTFYVQTDEENKVTAQSAPIVQRFAGQPAKNLYKWAKKFGGLHVTEFDKNRNALPAR